MAKCYNFFEKNLSIAKKDGFWAVKAQKIILEMIKKVKSGFWENAMSRFVQVAASLLVSPCQNLHNLDNCCSRWEIQALIALIILFELFQRPYTHSEATLERSIRICLAYLPSFCTIWFTTADKVTFFLGKNRFF